VDQPTQWHLPTDPALRTFFFALLFAVRARPFRSATINFRSARSSANPKLSQCEVGEFALRSQPLRSAKNPASQCENLGSQCDAFGVALR